MSLVNDMLRDLDNRSRHPVGNSHASLGYEGDVVSAFGGRKILVVAAVATLGVLLAGVWVLGIGVPRAVPSAVVDTPDTPLVARRADDLAGAAAEAPEVLPAVTARIAGERNRANGFELRLESTAEVSFEVLTRSDRQVTILLAGITALSNRVTSLSGVSVELVAEGLQVGIVQDQDTDFVIYENSNAFTYAVVVEGFWKAPPEAVISDSGSVTQATDDVAMEPPTTAANVDAPAAVVRAEPPRETNQASTPVRTQRQLSLQDRDRNASQQALRAAQSGQMQTAYSSLYDFIGKNPEAHQSRNTLITLLFAQQQYEQVDLLVEEGLSLVPNHSSYKKMKGRLLMMEGRYPEAIALLRNVPPAVAEDREYHELLASLYQQTGDFATAIATYQDLIRTDNNVGRWWAGMGISHESLGNTREALNSFEVALQIPGLESNLRQYSRNRISNLSGQ